MDRRDFAAITSNPLSVTYYNTSAVAHIRLLIILFYNYIIIPPSQLSFDLALISLPSSELIAGENALLHVTVKTEFLRLHLITGYTLICVGITLPLFYKCTPTQRALF